MKICLIGSTRFMEQYVEANRRLTLEGHVVYTVAAISTASGGELPEDQKMVLDLVHLRKIQESDCVALISDETGYYGFSTKREMIWAGMIGKDLAIYVPGDPRANLFAYVPLFGSKKILDIPSIETVAQVWDQVKNPKPEDLTETFGPLDSGNGGPRTLIGTRGGEA